MSISTWIQKNITGTGADYSRLPTGPDPDVQRIEQGVTQLKDHVDDLRRPVNVSIEGGYNKLTLKDKLVLGATGGAVVGGAFGAATGALTASAPFTVDAHMVTHDIVSHTVSFDQTRLQIAGVSQQATPTGLQDFSVPNAAIQYRFEPKITDKVIGHYSAPDGAVASQPFTTNSVVAGAEYAAAGMGIGLALTGALVAVQTARHKGAPANPDDGVDYGANKGTLVTSGVAGAAIGGLVAGADALAERARSGELQTIKWQEPVIDHNVTIGQIPKDATIIVRPDVRFDNNAMSNSQVYDNPSKFSLAKHISSGQKVDVPGDNPHTNIFGHVEMTDKHLDFTSHARYGIATTVLGGVALGTCLGVGAGVAINILNKITNA